MLYSESSVKIKNAANIGFLFSRSLFFKCLIIILDSLYNFLSSPSGCKLFFKSNNRDTQASTYDWFKFYFLFFISCSISSLNVILLYIYL